MQLISILENYLKRKDYIEKQNENIDDKLDDNKLDYNDELENEIGDELDNDKENYSFILNNSNKQTKFKERPKGTKRIKASHEKELSSVISKYYKCSQCGNMGHNR